MSTTRRAYLYRLYASAARALRLGWVGTIVFVAPVIVIAVGH